jgi:hypothetical protein
MNIDDPVPYIIGLVLALVGGSFIWKRIKYGSFKGAMFGSVLRSTIGEVSADQGSLVQTRLRVHLLSGRDATSSPAIGIEFIARSFASYQMIPITLTQEETRALISLLEKTLSNGSPNHAA